MRKQITIVTCDVCGAETTNQSQEIMVINDGNEYEYGIHQNTKPVIDRIEYRDLDLCNGCYGKLLQEPLFMVDGFHSPDKYKFKGVKN